MTDITISREQFDFLHEHARKSFGLLDAHWRSEPDDEIKAMRLEDIERDKARLRAMKIAVERQDSQEAQIAAAKMIEASRIRRESQ